MKIKEKSVKAVNSPQVAKERTFHVHLLVESVCIDFQKFILRQSFRLSLVLNLFLIFHRNSCPCSYNNVLIKKCGFLSADMQGRRKESRARGADRSNTAPTTLGQQIYPGNGGYPRHFLGNIMGYASHSHINDCLFQSNIACF